MKGKCTELQNNANSTGISNLIPISNVDLGPNNRISYYLRL